MRDSVNIVDTEEKCANLLERLWTTPYPVGVDTETVGINPRKESPVGTGRIVCWSISIYDSETRTGDQNFLWATSLSSLEAWLVSDRPKVGHNIFTFDWHMFANHGIALNGIVGDTLRMHKLLYPSKEKKHDLKSLGKHWLGYKQPTFDSLFTRPAGVVEYVQETITRKGVKIDVPIRESRRKVGEFTGVPTLLASGPRGRFGRATEFIPLDTIPTDYPTRLSALYSYATLDAKITLELYFRFRAELDETEWTL